MKQNQFMIHKIDTIFYVSNILIFDTPLLTINKRLKGIKGEQG